MVAHLDISAATESDRHVFFKARMSLLVMCITTAGSTTTVIPLPHVTRALIEQSAGHPIDFPSLCPCLAIRNDLVFGYLDWRVYNRIAVTIIIRTSRQKQCTNSTTDQGYLASNPES